MKSKHDKILQNVSKWHNEKAKGQQTEKLFLRLLQASGAIKNRENDAIEFSQFIMEGDAKKPLRPGW